MAAKRIMLNPKEMRMASFSELVLMPCSRPTAARSALLGMESAINVSTSVKFSKISFCRL